VTEFLLGCLLLVTVVDIFVVIFLVVCYEMNSSSVLVDLKWDFDQCFFAFILKQILGQPVPVNEFLNLGEALTVWVAMKFQK